MTVGTVTTMVTVVAEMTVVVAVETIGETTGGTAETIEETTAGTIEETMAETIEETTTGTIEETMAEMIEGMTAEMMIDPAIRLCRCHLPFIQFWGSGS